MHCNKTPAGIEFFDRNSKSSVAMSTCSMVDRFVNIEI